MIYNDRTFRTWTADEYKAAHLLFQCGFLRTSIPCKACKVPCELVRARKSKSPIEVAFRCSECKREFSARSGSPCANSKKSFCQWVSLLYQFTLRHRVSEMATTIEWHRNRVGAVTSQIRRCIGIHIAVTNTQLSGCVEVDESVCVFSGARKHNRGRKLHTRWVLGQLRGGQEGADCSSFQIEKERLSNPSSDVGSNLVPLFFQTCSRLTSISVATATVIRWLTTLIAFAIETRIRIQTRSKGCGRW